MCFDFNSIPRRTFTYEEALALGVPYPKVQPGELVYDGVHDANVPVCSLSFDNIRQDAAHGWRASTPGHNCSDRDLMRARADKSTKSFEVCGNTAKLVATFPPTLTVVSF